jgi:ornithine decarboxylase
MIIKEMIDLGNSFDCASTWEIKRVLQMGGTPEKIIFANACKARPHILYAKQVGVKMMTFDSVEEANNIHAVYPEAELVLRIAVEETDAPCPMTSKFGAPEALWL